MQSSTITNEADVDFDQYRQELKDAAHEIVKAGFPLTVAEGKNPGFAMGKGWQNQKLSPEVAERLIEKQQHPAIGIMLGPGGAIDFDVDGSHELDAFMELFGNDPPVMPVYDSGREGGEHRLAMFDDRLRAIEKATVTFKTGDGAKSITVRIGCKLQPDGSLSGAHSVAPPSLHSTFDKDKNSWRFTGKQYRWREGCSIDDVGLPKLKDAVIEKLLLFGMPRASKPSRTLSAVEAADFYRDGGGPRQKALSAMLRYKVEQENDGSKRLFFCACRCVEHDLNDEQAVLAIRDYEELKPFPKDYSDDEILDRVRSAEQSETRGSAAEFSNGYEFLPNGSENTEIAPHSMPDVLEQLRVATGGWPRRVGGALFIDDPEHGIGWLEKQASLFGWIRSKRDVTWYGGKKMVTRDEFFHELLRTSKVYDAVETLPHEPTIASHYYACKTPYVGDGKALQELLNRFRPETTVDRDLIQAAIMSTFWGGPAGSRPAFVITADEGRGVGKTKLAEIISHLCGGMVDVSAGEDIAVLKQRFLSPEALTKRVGLIDNIKSMRFSWAELESLITTPVISGKRLYVGEAVRPNTITWMMTLNGVSLATDMAQRSVIIKLARGANAGTWYEDTIRFVDDNRQRLIGDVISALQAERFPLHSYTRWAAWERDILSRLPEPGDAQKLILERQGEADSDSDEAGIIEDFFAEQLSKFSYDPQVAQVRIPVAVVGKWYCWATNESAKTAAVTKKLKQMANEGQTKLLAPDPSRHYGRCFIWTGPAADVHNQPISNDLQTRIGHYQKTN